MKLAACISTYNRIDYLRQALSSYYKTRNTNHQWYVYITDDGSTDGTIEYLSSMPEIKLIKLNRTGLCNSMNVLIEHAIKDNIDYGFRFDDDVVFKRSGWDDLYMNSSIASGYDHLIFFDYQWAVHRYGIDRVKANNEILECKIINKEMRVQTFLKNILYAQGAFFTFTHELINTIGYFDNTNFGGCGFHHIDFAARACRAGFNLLYSNNKTAGPWDALDSEEYISLIKEQYTGIRNKLSKKEKKRRIKILSDSSRGYISHTRKFSGDWTTFYTVNWNRWLNRFIGADGINGLEVGCYEGRSSCWFCDNILTGNGSTLTCVDRFGVYKRKKIEPIFDSNIKGLQINKLKGESAIILAKLVIEEKKFDFIYLDGDHHRTPVLIDFVNCWQLLKKGGVIICDDYHYTGVRVSVSSALKCFKYSVNKIEITPKIKRKRIQIAIWKK